MLYKMKTITGLHVVHLFYSLKHLIHVGTYPKFHQNILRKTIISNSPYFDLLSNKIVLMIVSLERIANDTYVTYGLKF
jgi:hypothetical protein